MQLFFIVRGDSFYTYDYTSCDPWTDDENKAAKQAHAEAARDAQRIADNEGQPVTLIGVEDGESFNFFPTSRFVTAYAVTREYGGPEEGGWWYNRNHFLASIPLESVTEREASEFLTKAFAHVNEGDLSSVRGGSALLVADEWESGQFSTKQRPHYE